MKERPILFSGPMVRAILDGRKTQTRRVVRPKKYKYEMAVDDWMNDRRTFADGTDPNDRYLHIPCLSADDEGMKDDGVVRREYCPYGQPGDRLWVRETHFQTVDNEHHERPSVSYAEEESKLYPGHWRKVPSIFMPRWASRITLEITAVRVERVKEISQSDAEAEGIPGCRDHLKNVHAVEWFKSLWDSINAKRGFSWESNPWVWVVEFKRIQN